jgi:tetratricopeptide (TPR) repeat protein
MHAYKKIEKYIQGDMKEPEVKEFENTLENDEKLFREYQLRKEIEDALGEDDVMELRGQMQDIMVEESPAPVIRFKRKAIVAAVVGALILGLGSMGYYYYQSTHGVTTDKIFQEYYEPYEATITFRSGVENEVNSLLTNAFEKYKEQQYRDALQLFQKVLNNKGDVAASLYSGISYMEIEKYKRANQSFDDVIEDKDNLFIYQAKWYMAMCHIKLQNKDKALAILDELKQGSDYYKGKAEEVINKLDRISN